VVVKVNDRGPFQKNRLIDLSYAAAAKLDIVAPGTGLVEVRAIDPRTYTRNEVASSPSVPEGGIRDFYIQVGAFSYRLNAEKLRNRLTVLNNVSANISKAVVDGRAFYRVRIGPLREVDVADRIVSSLDRLGIFNHRIVTN
jgi:rare lipoprotein A